MIQRIQSIWLLLAAAAAFLTLKFSFYSGNIIAAGSSSRTYAALTAQGNMLLLILTAGLGLASLISIFLYKNRKQQFRIVLLCLVISIINLVLFFVETRKYVVGEGNFDLTAAIAFAVPIFLFLALRGIRKDDKLVKSLDRLR